MFFEDQQHWRRGEFFLEIDQWLSTFPEKGGGLHLFGTLYIVEECLSIGLVEMFSLVVHVCNITRNFMPSKGRQFGVVPRELGAFRGEITIFYLLESDATLLVPC